MWATFINSVGGCHVGDFILWNQKGADSGSFLFAGMARSHKWLAPTDQCFFGLTIITI
jgi:hypothetical protein